MTTKKSHKTNHDVGQHIGQLAEDAHALMAATADATGEKVKEARERLGAALERTKEMGESLKEQAFAGAKIADEHIREHPYQALAVGVGVGAILGFLMARK